MKKAIPYLLLFGLFYGAWYYWQQRPKPPLKADLLPYAATDVNRLLITPADASPFELSRATNGWVVEAENRSINSKDGKGEKLLNSLLAIRSSGIGKKKEVGRELLHVSLKGDDVADELVVYAAPDSFPVTTYLVRFNELADYYRIDNFRLTNLPLHFNDYRDRNLLDLGHHNRLDSLVWWAAIDSSRNLLMERTTADSNRLDSLQQAWSPQHETIFADFFGETRHATHLLGHYLIYGSGDSIPDQLSVYNNSRWEKPYVIKGTGSEYFALDSLSSYSF